MSEVMEHFFSGQLGGLTVMVVTAAVIVLFLRILYGPGGLLRDPRWDAGHRRIRQNLKRREERIRAAQEGREAAGDSDER